MKLLNTAACSYGIATSLYGLHSAQEMKGKERELQLTSNIFYLFGGLQGLAELGAQPLWFAGAFQAYRLAALRNSTLDRTAATFEMFNYGLVFLAGTSRLTQGCGALATILNGTSLATKHLFESKSLP
jgi:hypothetical protein